VPNVVFSGWYRIGQTKDVKIYRLITRNTYEQRLFECSSKKYGLDEAILGNNLGSNVDVEHTKNIETLLKRGAYDILKVRKYSLWIYHKGQKIT
jgi:chromodomain-helicase-DNA-binding protein 7